MGTIGFVLWTFIIRGIGQQANYLSRLLKQGRTKTTIQIDKSVWDKKEGKTVWQDTKLLVVSAKVHRQQLHIST